MVHIITLLAAIAFALLGVFELAIAILVCWVLYIVIWGLFVALFGTKPKNKSVNTTTTQSSLNIENQSNKNTNPALPAIILFISAIVVALFLLTTDI